MRPVEMADDALGSKSDKTLTPERLACAMYQALRRSSRSSENSLSYEAMVDGDALSRHKTIDGTFDLVKGAAKALKKLRT